LLHFAIARPFLRPLAKQSRCCKLEGAVHDRHLGVHLVYLGAEAGKYLRVFV
jgi:hypothetical protein